MRELNMFASHFTKRVRLYLLLGATIVVVVFASYTSGGHKAHAENVYIDGVEIGSLAIDELGDREPTARDLFQGIYCSTFGDSLEAYQSVGARDINASYLLTASAMCSGDGECGFSHFPDQQHETYYFTVTIEDMYMTDTLSFRYDVFDDYHMTEVRLETQDTVYHVDGILWVCSENDVWSLSTTVKPDGKLLVSYYGDNGINSATNSVTLNPLKIEQTSQGYEYIADDIFPMRLNSAGYIYFHTDYTSFEGDKYYPEGYESRMRAIELTSGNSVGNTSSNLYGYGYAAKEGNVLLSSSYDQLSRTVEEPYDRYVLRISDYNFTSLNLINGIMFYCEHYEDVHAATINGDSLWSASGNRIVADDTYAFYSGTDGGVFRVTLATWEEEQVISRTVQSLCMDGDHVYWLQRDGLYKMHKESTDSAEMVVDDSHIGGFIVDDGVIVYWTDDSGGYSATDLYVYAVDEETGVASTRRLSGKERFGGTFWYNGQDLPYMAFADGWIYYYYPQDTTLICRMNLSGSVVDQFVCYGHGSCEPLYIFDGKLYVDTYEVADLSAIGGN